MPETRTVRLAWTASPDDGAGDNDVSSYEIARSPAPNPTVVIATVDATPAPDDTTHSEDLAYGTYFYRIRAVDAAGNRSTWTLQVVVTVTAAGVSIQTVTSTLRVRDAFTSTLMAQPAFTSTLTVRPAFSSRLSVTDAFKSTLTVRPAQKSDFTVRPAFRSTLTVRDAVR